MENEKGLGADGMEVKDLPIEEVSVGDPLDDIEVTELPIDEEIALGDPSEDQETAP